MKKHKEGCSIREANDLDTVCRLRRDNISTSAGSHIWADEKVVSVGKRNDDGTYTSTTMTKAQFNILIDWYNRKQKFVRK